MGARFSDKATWLAQKFIITMKIICQHPQGGVFIAKFEYRATSNWSNHH
jgi:hypothetical protein